MEISGRWPTIEEVREMREQSNKANGYVHMHLTGYSDYSPIVVKFWISGEFKTPPPFKKEDVVYELHARLFDEQCVEFLINDETPNTENMCLQLIKFPDLPKRGEGDYRILDVDDLITATDQFLEDDAQTWTDIGGDHRWCVGNWWHTGLKPMRRKTTGLK